MEKEKRGVVAGLKKSKVSLRVDAAAGCCSEVTSEVRGQQPVVGPDCRLTAFDSAELLLQHL